MSKSAQSTRRQAAWLCFPKSVLSARAALLGILLLLGCDPPDPPSPNMDHLQGDPINPPPAFALDAAPAATRSFPGPSSVESPAGGPDAEAAVAFGLTEPPWLPAASSPSPAVGLEDVGPLSEEDYHEIGFSLLAGYEIEITDSILHSPTNSASGPPRSVQEQIPQAVKDLNQKQVMLKGFMLPLKIEGGLVTELLLMKDQSMCCFGATPRINDWVSVKMTGPGVPPLMDQPVTFFGRLQVGEMRENGYLVGIYAMKAESMAGPLDF